MSRLLVTGATGFVGRHLLAHLALSHPDHEVWATGHEPRPESLPAHHYEQVDLTRPDALEGLVDRCRPAGVLHLAGTIRGTTLADFLPVNVCATDRLYQALARLENAHELRIVQVSSASVYGQPEELPVQEALPLRPVTPYGVSKASQELVSLGAQAVWGLRIVRARIFNLVGPGQPRHLAPAVFLDSLRSGEETLAVGNLESRRDFIDVRDAAAALALLLDRGATGKAVNVASGIDVSIAELLKRVESITGRRVRVEVSPDRLRRLDVPRIVADITRLRDLGFQSRHILDESLADMWQEEA